VNFKYKLSLGEAGAFTTFAADGAELDKKVGHLLAAGVFAHDIRLSVEIPHPEGSTL
jgi:hypothetical protein